MKNDIRSTKAIEDLKKQIAHLKRKNRCNREMITSMMEHSKSNRIKIKKLRRKTVKELDAILQKNVAEHIKNLETYNAPLNKNEVNLLADFADIKSKDIHFDIFGKLVSENREDQNEN